MAHRVARVAFHYRVRRSGDADLRLVVINQVDAGLSELPEQDIVVAGAGEQSEGHSAICLSLAVVVNEHAVGGRVGASSKGDLAGAQAGAGHKVAGLALNHRQHHRERCHHLRVAPHREHSVLRAGVVRVAFCHRVRPGNDPDSRPRNRLDDFGIVVGDCNGGAAGGAQAVGGNGLRVLQQGNLDAVGVVRRDVIHNGERHHHRASGHRDAQSRWR